MAVKFFTVGEVAVDVREVRAETDLDAGQFGPVGAGVGGETLTEAGLGRGGRRGHRGHLRRHAASAGDGPAWWVSMR